MIRIPSDIGLTFNDFKVEIVEISECDIKYDSISFRPRIKVIHKVNGVIIEIYAKISMDMISDLTALGLNIDENIILEATKSEAILKYINSISYVRKEKLKKIENENR